MGARQFGELEVVGSIPTTQTISYGSLAERLCSRLLSGQIQLQPLGGPPISSTWAFGRTVMHLPLKETDVGSTPTAPTKDDASVMQSVDIACLNQVCCRFDSCQRYSRRWSYGALWGLISPHLVGSNPTSATKCRCDVTGNMRLSYSLHAGSTPVACSKSCRCSVVGQHQDLVCPGREFKPRHLLVLV